MERSDSTKFLGLFRTNIFHGKTILNLQRTQLRKKEKKLGIFFKSKPLLIKNLLLSYIYIHIYIYIYLYSLYDSRMKLIKSA